MRSFTLEHQLVEVGRCLFFHNNPDRAFWLLDDTSAATTLDIRFLKHDIATNGGSPHKHLLRIAATTHAL